ARYNGLPGMPCPGPSSAYPGKDQIADYLAAYARAFALPVRTGLRVERVTARSGRFEAWCGEQLLSADNIVIATGAYHRPMVPAFAAGLDAAILQLHSCQYRNRSQLRQGSVLVVGAGNSGAEIAMDLASHHRIWLS